MQRKMAIKTRNESREMLTWLRFVEKHNARLLALPQAFLKGVGALPNEPLPAMESVLGVGAHETLSVADLRSLARLRREFASWSATAQNQREALRGTLPDSIWEEAWTPDRLAALTRIDRLLSLEPNSPSEAWLAGLKLWSGAFGIAKKEVVWRCKPTSSSHPRFSHYSDLFQRSETLADLPGHRWLAGCQGEAEGVLQMDWQLPLDAMERQVALYQSDLGPAAEGRSASSLLQELVTDDLVVWLRRWASQRATEQAIEAATTSYRELLLQEPPSVDTLTAIYIGGEHNRVGLVCLRPDGTVQDELSFAPIERNGKTDLQQTAHKARKWLRERSCQDVALPLRAASRVLLQEMTKELQSHVSVHRVRVAGLSAAREKWCEAPHHLSREVAAATALGHRLLCPKEEWARLAPLSLGLAEYQDLLDTQQLQAALEDERALVQAQLVKVTPSAFSNRTQATKQLNPLVKGLGDLKAGMTLQGTITNLTDFGAFVHVGLPEEGLVHKSELADRFVRHPSEVVRVGQDVTVRVLNVEMESRRLSLSMRSSMRPKPQSSRQKRSQALQSLENLFKK
jgi:transcriptional accessory protein Tex/SPT6